MYINKEILNLEYPYNILYSIDIKTPTEDQINGFYHVFSFLKDNTKKVILLRFKDRLLMEEIAKYCRVTKQAVSYKLNYELERLKNNDYIQLGLRVALSKEKEKRLNEIKQRTEYYSFENIYKRVMSKQEKDENNIKKVKDYLFNKTKIPIELKDIEIKYRSGKLPVLVRTFNCLMRANICRLDVNSRDESPNVYALLYHIYENPFSLIKIRNLGKVGIIDVYSTLYNMKYITEEQLLFVYLYGKLYTVKSFEELKNFYLTYKEQIRIGG